MAGDNAAFDVHQTDPARLSSGDKTVRFTVKAILHFDDGVNKGNLSVDAISADDAKRQAIAKLVKIWGIPESSIDILDIRKG